MDNKWYCEWYSHYGNGIYWLCPRTPEILMQGFKIPMLNTNPTFIVHQRNGESLWDHVHHLMWLFCEQLGKGLSFDYFYHSNLSIATHLPRYLSTSSTKLPWKQWLEVVAKGELRITGRRIHCRHVEWPQYYRSHLLGWNSHCHCLCKWL